MANNSNGNLCFSPLVCLVGFMGIATSVFLTQLAVIVSFSSSW